MVENVRKAKTGSTSSALFTFPWHFLVSSKASLRRLSPSASASSSSCSFYLFCLCHLPITCCCSCNYYWWLWPSARETAQVENRLDARRLLLPARGNCLHRVASHRIASDLVLPHGCRICRTLPSAVSPQLNSAQLDAIRCDSTRLESRGVSASLQGEEKS